MTKAPLVVTALFILTGCTTTANLKATPLKEQSAAQIDSDRKRCAEVRELVTPSAQRVAPKVRAFVDHAARSLGTLEVLRRWS